MMPGLPVSSIPQCKWKCPKDVCLELFQAIECFECTFIEAHKVWNMVCKVRSLKWWIKTREFLEDITITRNMAFEDSESDITRGIWKLGNSTWETVKSYLKVNSWFFNIDIRAMTKKTVRPARHCMYICEVVYIDMLKWLTVKNSI